LTGAGTPLMHRRFTCLIAAVVLTGGVGRAGELPATRPQPVLDVRQRLPEWVGPGESVPIEVTIVNTGTGPAEDVTASSTLPPDLDLTEATPTPERVRGALLWTLGPLAPGQQQVLRLRVTPHPGAAVSEMRSVVRVTYQSSITSACAAAVRRPVLALEVAGPDVGVVGEAVSYVLTVRNAGAVPAGEVALQALLPAGLLHPAGNDLENDLGTLGPGDTRQITLRLTPTQAGDLRQHLRVCAAGAQSVERDVCLRAQEIKLSLAANGPRLLYENWPASFEFVVRNDGTEAVPRARLGVALPEGVAFVRANENGVYGAGDHSLSWDLGDLRPGQERTLLWNGVARQVGEQTCQVVLTSGGKTWKRLTWRTTVVKPAPTLGPVPTATAPPVDTVVPPAPPPTPAPPPETGAPGPSQAAVGPPLPAPPDPSGWRLARHPPPRGPLTAGAVTPSP
jgi:uncharacterized repeat protein (TIGR01451 family)